ncbi:MAG: hypothetical protein OIF57_00075 [Marinobacterium sp.]|nr:hypothetical protein [Marinobacterium sp.]
MKIDSSMIELSSQSYRQQKQTLHSGLNADGNSHTGGVSLSAEGRLRSAHQAHTLNHSIVSQAGHITEHRLETAYSSLVSATLNSALPPSLEISIDKVRLESRSERPADTTTSHTQSDAGNTSGNLNTTTGVQTYQAIAPSERIGLPDSSDENHARQQLQAANTANRHHGHQGYATLSMTNSELYHESEQMTFSSQGRIHTEDGREINYRLELDMARDFEREIFQQVRAPANQLIDPLTINLDGGAAGLASGTFRFDLNADGQEENISFARQGTGFLALDRNYDGKINDGSELFGTGRLGGYEQLSRYDSDNNNWIDENDSIFKRLKVWSRDADGDDQLVSLKKAGIGAIHLGSVSSSFELTGMGNDTLGQIKRSGVVLMEDGRVTSMQELDLAIQSETDITSDSGGNDDGSGGISLTDSFQQLLNDNNADKLKQLQEEQEKARLAAELAAAQNKARAADLSPAESQRLQQQIQELRAEHEKLNRKVT